TGRIGSVWCRDGDAEVEAVEERRGDPPPVAEPLRLRARARRRPHAAGARVRARDELERGGEDQALALARDVQRSLLERLSKRVQRVGCEFTELVEEEDPAVRERGFTGPRPNAAAAHERRDRCRVMRRAERALCDETATMRSPGGGVDARHLDALVG